MATDEPPRASSPSPFDTRRSISAASAGRFETSSRSAAFSYQRKAGIPSFEPWRIPAWEAEVWDGSSTSQRAMRWDPLRTQRARCGALPVRIANRSSGSASPSTCTITTPGRPSPGVAGPRRASSSTTDR